MTKIGGKPGMGSARWPCAVILIAAATVLPAAQAASAVVYLHIDHHFYRADGPAGMSLFYLGSGGDYAWDSATAQMASCNHGNPASDGHVMFFFGTAQPPLDIEPNAIMRYNTYGGAFDQIGVLSLKTTWGDVECTGSVPVPYQYDYLFAAGFQGQ